MSEQSQKPTILVTGVSGNLGRRLLPFLGDFNVVGVDRVPVAGHPEIAVHPINLGQESSCDELVRALLAEAKELVAEGELVRLLRETKAEAVVHLAFVIDPLRTGVTDRDAMWQINVAGTARVMEAIAEVNRNGGHVRKFLYPSSVAVYGPETPPFVDEEAPHNAHTLSYAVQKAEADSVVRFRAAGLGACSVYILRPHIFAGASVENYLVNAIRGRAFGNGKMAERMRRKNQRLPLLLPFGKQYPEKLFQFVHVDDVARLFNWLLHRTPPAETPVELLVLNVAGSGEPITLACCAEIAHAKVVRLPGRGLCAWVLQFLWDRGISSVPPDAFPYMCGSYTMTTARLQELLGEDYPKVIQYSTEAALTDSFREQQAAVPTT